jgi:phosphoribosylanthranilate isomerase
MKNKAKICGLTHRSAVQAAVKNGADYIGFVFYAPSPRHIEPEKAQLLTQLIPESIKTVAVVVDMDDEEFNRIFQVFKPDYLQLHGHETQERVKEIREKFGIPVIKAISVRSSDDIASGAAYAKVSDMLLFDAKAPVTSPLPGGNGLTFDWTLLQERSFEVPWILSGGLNGQNVGEAMRVTGATIVDVSSSIESEPGIKDETLMALFLNKVKAT